MGKGGYNGGSTIIGPWSSGWFSTGARRGGARTEAQQHVLAERIVAERVERTARSATKAAKKAENAADKVAKATAAQKRKRELAAMPRVKKTPEQIARRLGRAMEGVDVRRCTSNTLRLRKPDSD